MITLTSLSKIYRTNEIETVALENVNLTVDRGEFLSIMGPSGCGKSTLLYILSTMDTDYEGELSIDGVMMRNKKENELALVRNEKIGFVFDCIYFIDYIIFFFFFYY